MISSLPDHIQTTRLVLRKAALDDAQGLFDAYTADPAVARYMTFTPQTHVSGTRTFLQQRIDAWAQATGFTYVLCRQESPNTLIGLLAGDRVKPHMLDIGYALTQTAWGYGLMPEAINAFAEVALATAGLYRLQATCDVDNAASAHALEKSGFTREARLERYGLHPNISPSPRACYLYARWR